ncbi:hypothetical protein [Actinomyces sp. 432]|uniref:hypothetical protein n=1 Tax=Actinomyces sp. 432 TaxID=2057798 RepID=UPI001F37BA9F|nr:hypothetical protein [Actinomyces sp. 432]
MSELPIHGEGPVGAGQDHQVVDHQVGQQQVRNDAQQSATRVRAGVCLQFNE